MSSPSTSTNHEEWEALVGKALLRFGDIELVSIKCLAWLPKDKIGATTARMDFGRRVDLLIELLEAREGRDSHLDAILSGMKQAKGLARKRNLIAHNPVMLNLYVNEDETQHMAEYSISSARSEGQTMDLAELKEFAAEVDDLSATLWMAFLKSTGTSDHLVRERGSR
jgi:hypothetical protein